MSICVYLRFISLSRINADTPWDDNEARRYDGIPGNVPGNEATPLPCRESISLEGKMKNGKSACFTTDYTDFDGFHGEISLFSNELTAHPAG